MRTVSARKGTAFLMKKPELISQEAQSEWPEKKKIIQILVFTLYPVLEFYLMEAYEHNPFAEVRQMAQLFNIILFELAAWLFYLLTDRMHVAVRMELIIAAIFGITNHYIMKFRSTPFVPWDIFSVKTAKSVASNYDFTPDKRMMLVTAGFLVLFLSAGIIKNAPKIKWKFRLISAVLVVAVLCLFAGNLQKESFQLRYRLYPYLFTPAYMTKVNGMAVTFTMNLAYAVVKQPDGYSMAEAEEILKEHETDAAEDTKELPNIIVIMDEAFSDLAVLGDTGTDEDYMPFMHRMQKGQENTITGNVQVSVCGGNTANSEFEFLTGNTMAFLPAGSIPYQQYIRQETFSSAGWLKSLGYETYAQHPYSAGGWERNRVYPLLGFSHMSFINDYVPRNYVRKYVSDASDMQHIIRTFENKKAGKPVFIFNVTMQNHGGYTDTYTDFTSDIHSEYKSKALDQYLSLVKMSDDALEELIAYFEGQEEKTVIVFFGDHQPNNTVAAPVLRAMGKDTADLSAEDQKKRYQVPYLIWANYDMKSAVGQDTSLNYLAAEVFEAAGIPLNGYQNYLLEVKKSYPVLSAAGIESETAEEQILETYKRLQYYQLFEKGKNNSYVK